MDFPHHDDHAIQIFSPARIEIFILFMTFSFFQGYENNKFFTSKIARTVLLTEFDWSRMLVNDWSLGWSTSSFSAHTMNFSKFAVMYIILMLMPV